MNKLKCGIVGSQLSSYHSMSKLKLLLNSELVKMIENQSVREFISGMHLGPEMLAAELVLKLKKRYPVKLWGILESEEQWIRWSEEEQDHFFSIMEQADYEYRVGNRSAPESHRRQLHIIAEESDFLIVVEQVIPDEMLQALTYARRHRKRVLWVEPQSLRVTPFLE